jgi:hypothetical protein
VGDLDNILYAVRISGRELNPPMADKEFLTLISQKTLI